jgi:phospholipid/cholesterol/gamma-HCH transport system substrate-binding protein
LKLSREVKTGILVLVGILAVIMGFSYLKSSSIFDKSRTFYAVYDHVGGLQSGTQVSLNGLVVGNVTSIRFKDGSGKLLVTFIVNNDFEFSENSKVELFDTGIIGGKGLQIIPAFDGAPNALPGDTLVSSSRPGLTELVQQKLTPLQMSLESTFTDADTLLTNINSILDDRTKRELQESIAGLNQLIGTFQGSASKLNALMEENGGQLDSTLKNVNTITTNFSKISDSLANAGLGKTMTNLQSTVSSLNQVLGKIERGEGTLGKMANDEELYNNLTEVSRELDLLLQDFRLNPKRYVNVSVFGKKQKDYELPEEDPAANNDQ